MAEKPKEAPAQPTSGEPAKKGLPIKTIAVMLVMLVVEAGAIIGVMAFLGKPSEVKGLDQVEAHHADPGDELQELPVLKEKYTNNSTGRVWIWDTEIMIQVKQRHAEKVTAALEARSAEIRTGIGKIFSSAQHHYFFDPGRETLTRQSLEYLRSILGRDEDGEEYVVGVLIPRCMGMPGEF